MEFVFCYNYKYGSNKNNNIGINFVYDEFKLDAWPDCIIFSFSNQHEIDFLRRQLR